MDQPLDVGVPGLVFLRVGHPDAVVIQLFSPVLGDPVAVEHQHHLIPGIGGEVHQKAHELFPGVRQLLLCQAPQILPGEDHVVSVHDVPELLRLENDRFRRLGGGGGGAAVLRPADGTELPQKDGLQLLFIDLEVLPVQPGNGGPGLLQTAFQVHVVLYPVPLHVEATAVGAEDGIRRILRVPLRVVARRFHRRFRIGAEVVAVLFQGEPAPPAGVGRHQGGVAVQLRHRSAAPEEDHISRLPG